jgi:hypothetical protein
MLKSLIIMGHELAQIYGAPNQTLSCRSVLKLADSPHGLLDFCTL